MSPGLFDVLGPVMHGPSSNHTGGAGRIGYLARLLMGGQPDRVVLGFHPDYMKSYSAQHSDVGLIAGCLGIREFDVDFPAALRKAEEAGMSWSAAPVKSDACSRNTMRVTGFFRKSADTRKPCAERADFDVKQAEEEVWSVNGDSVGGGSIVIDSLNGIPVSLTGNEHVLLLYGEGRKLRLSAERAVKDWLCGKGSLVSGTGTDGRELIVACLPAELIPEKMPVEWSKELPEKLQEKLPEAVRKAISAGTWHIRLVPPIYDFGDTGAGPYLTDFEGLLKLTREGISLPEVAVRYEMRHSGCSEQRVLQEGRFLVSVIRDSLKRGESGNMSFIGGFADPDDGRKLFQLAETGMGCLTPGFTRALARAVTLAGMNAAGSNRIVACPTGGSAGTLPAVLLTAAERYGADDETLAKAFLAAGLIGVIIGNRASFSGTVGGCQSEVGIGAAMGAAGVAYLAGASGEISVQCAAIALKNVLGLSCDPPAPATEVPCIKRNAMGVAVAFFGADMGLAGVRSVISPDDVVDALADSQRRLPTDIKFGGRGGLAGTASGKELMRRWKERSGK